MATGPDEHCRQVRFGIVGSPAPASVEARLFKFYISDLR